VIYCTQFILLVLAGAVGIAIVAVVLRAFRPHDDPARVIAEYASAFLFFLAVAAFRGGILGQRKKPGVWEPQADWLSRARQEATATFFVMLATAWAYALLSAAKSEIPWWLVAVALVVMLASRPRKGRRTRRPAW
jgi:hypothetical protein